MDIAIGSIGPDQYDAYTGVATAAFGWAPPDEELATLREGVEWQRTIAAFDGDRMVGTGGAFSMRLTVPGGAEVPVGGLTWISVLPTHRRRGILRAMIERHFIDVAGRGEPVSVLNASESAIYGRFGYGLGTAAATFEIDPRRAAFLRPVTGGGQARLVDAAEAEKVLRGAYDGYRRGQPGELTRDDHWWSLYLRDPEWDRHGASRHFDVVYETAPGEVTGWASYRVEDRWEGGLPNNRANARVYATEPAAAAALYRYLLDLDLVGTLRLLDRPADEPLRWLLADPRRLRVTDLNDSLWVRLLDVPAALAARRYGVEDRLVLEVRDAALPDSGGRFVLEGGPDGAGCQRGGGTADLALGAAELGAAYLGGVGFGTLARAGRVDELTPGALRRADAMFATDPEPLCQTHF